MRKIIVILGMLMFGGSLYSQEVELPTYVSHLADNPFVISPTYAGIGAGLQMRLNGVSQWIGLENAPDTQSLSIEARIAERFGGGIIFFNDKNGYTSQQGAKLSFASHLTLSDFHNSFLSFALSYSYTQFNLDTSENNSGETLPNRSFGNSNFDVGMLFRFEKFSITFNIGNLLDKDVRDFDTNEPKILRKYTVFSSYVFSKLSTRFEVEPSMLVEYREFDKRSRTDLNVKVRKGIRDGYLWAGLSYTFLNDQFFNPNSLGPLLGLKKNNLFMSYGFGINLNKVQDFNYGTHMITLGFDYDKRPSLARCTQKMMIF